MLRSLVTSLIENGKIETTETRAKEVKRITEKLITLAIREADNFSSKQVKVTRARVDSGGRKITKSATSKNNNKYDVVDREEVMDMKTVDSPSRLHARRQIMKWLYRASDKDGKRLNLVNKMFDEIAPKYKDRNGGYTRIYKVGPRRGDAAEIVILELV
jgi:large subunit ribosomal protein L17